MFSFCAASEVATFAGGCFWCVEADLEKIKGVSEVVSGYTGGERANPTYEQVSSGQTKHIEAVQVNFDKEKISYEKLLIKFLKTIDPTDNKGQFVDRGYQYTTAIFYHSEKQRKIANNVIKYLKETKKFPKIVTPVLKHSKFYRAESYHQNFYKKNKKSMKRYKSYRSSSGRDKFINKYWKNFKFNLGFRDQYHKPSLETLKKKLTKLQYYVTQEDGTERPFKNLYWDNKEEGIYVDIVSGQPLFSSNDKFKSGTGWPSFKKPIHKKFLVEKVDKSLFVNRTEVRSQLADSHLGHVFQDGPKPLKLRYCINSASLRFIPKNKLIQQGYENFLWLFEASK